MNIYNKNMSFKDLLFPKLCLNCHLPGAYICPCCQKYLLISKNHYCFFCKKPSLYGLTHQNCLKKFNINGVASFFYYNNFFKKIIKNIKYRLATDIWKELQNIIKIEDFDSLDFYKNLSGKIFFQPIPLSSNKLKERGFNQALLITNFFQNYFYYPTVDFLLRVKETKPQAEIKSKKQRYLNLKGAFKIKKEFSHLVNNSKIILVDDVITSGSTVKEAAKVLKKVGAEKIYVLTLAKG